MTNKFIEPIKTFLKITRENLKWAASEIQHQYFLSALRDIEKKYPELHTEVEAFTEHLDAIFYELTDEDEDCPDFVEPPDSTNVDLTNLKEGDYLSNRFSNTPEDGLNEPDYPYDTEPSA